LEGSHETIEEKGDKQTGNKRSGYEGGGGAIGDVSRKLTKANLLFKNVFDNNQHEDNEK
jgi:hypothetical protein